MDCVDIKEKNENHGDLAQNPCPPCVTQNVLFGCRNKRASVTAGSAITAASRDISSGIAGLCSDLPFVPLVSEKKSLPILGKLGQNLATSGALGAVLDSKMGNLAKKCCLGASKVRENILCAVGLHKNVERPPLFVDPPPLPEGGCEGIVPKWELGVKAPWLKSLKMG